MSTTLPSQIVGTVATAAGSGLDTASHLLADVSHRVADATESFGDIASAAIDVGGNAAGVVADSTVRGAQKVLEVAPDAVSALRRHPILASSAIAVLVAWLVMARRRRTPDDRRAEARTGPRGVASVDAA